MPYFYSNSTQSGIYEYVSSSAEKINNQENPQEVLIESVEVIPFELDQFAHICLNNYLKETDDNIVEAKVGLSTESETFLLDIFQKPFLNRINNEINDYTDGEIKKSFDKALEGDFSGAYNNLLKFAMFTENEHAYIYSKEGENTPQKLPQYMEQKFQNVPEFVASMKMIKNLTDMNVFISYSRTGTHTPINPYLTISNLEKFSDSLTEKQISTEQKAKIYFLASQMFKERNMYGIETLNQDGIHYVEKAISLSSDYNLISNCLRNLNKRYDKKNIKDAYKRAGIEAEKEKNYNLVYAINKKMVEIYSSEKGIGYLVSGEAILKMEKYATLAIAAIKKSRLHSKEEINSELRKLIDIQLKNGNIRGAIKSKEEIANNLQGKDKYNALISIIGIAGEHSLQYINKISTLISKDKMNYKDKDELFQNLLHETSTKVTDPETKEKGKKLIDKRITFNNLFLTQKVQKSRM